LIRLILVRASNRAAEAVHGPSGI